MRAGANTVKFNVAIAHGGVNEATGALGINGGITQHTDTMDLDHPAI